MIIDLDKKTNNTIDITKNLIIDLDKKTNNTMFEYKYYIRRDRYNDILERLKAKVTTNKSRYKFDLYQINDKTYYYALNIKCEDKLIQTKMLVDLAYDDDGIYVVYVTSAASKTKVRLTILG